MQREQGVRAPTVRQFMTASPCTIAAGQTLAAAQRLMREHGIRHLPVVDDGLLVGLVSQRDVHFLESLRDVDPDVVTVDEAMTPDPFTVSPGAPLRRVVAAMAERKYGSAVVVHRHHVVGVFTTIDAMRALVEVLHDSPQ